MNSQDGSSEAFIGEWAEQRGIRDRLFVATKVFSISTMSISVMTGIFSLCFSIQTTLTHATNRCLPKRLSTLETMLNLFISHSNIRSRTCEPTTSICFMFIGGTGILVSKKSWGHCTTLFSKGKFYIWYVLSIS